MKQLRGTKQKYGFRKIKYVAGLASAVLASVSLNAAKPQTVHADTTNNKLSDHRTTGEKAAEEELDHMHDNPNSKTQSTLHQTSQKRTVHIIDDSTQQDLKQEKPVKNAINKNNTPNVNKSIVDDKEVETSKTTDTDYIPDTPKETLAKNTINKNNTPDVNKSIVHDKDVETPKTTNKNYIPDTPKEALTKTISHIANNTVDHKTIQTDDISTAALDLQKKQIATKLIKMIKLSNNFSLYNTSLFALNNVDTTSKNTVFPNYTTEALNKKIGNIINTDLSSVTKNSIKDVYHYVPHFSPTTVKIYTYVPHFAPTVVKAYQSIPTFGTKLRKANTLNPALLGFKPSNIPVQKPHNLATLGLMTTMLSILSK